MFIFTDTIRVCSITDKIIPFQSGSVFSKRAKLTSAQYKHRVLFTEDDSHRVIFTIDDPITIGSRRGLNLGPYGLQFLAPSAIWASLLQLIQFFDWPKIFLNDKWRHKGLPFSSLWRPILILRFRFLHQIRLTSPTHKKINLINIL